ncbi:hypothetical protein [Chondrinema litorale]|uniref:hypothetical protein n=1 Tax=Chondrinema litorale TaxID=2994555 RepID=UPI0025428C54|nr:hypothetical protein [Chondrinema litorale]UZR98646.1 hypothetical protein OQ292_32985 [Chondrinema litorale]
MKTPKNTSRVPPNRRIGYAIPDATGSASITKVNDKKITVVYWQISTIVDAKFKKYIDYEPTYVDKYGNETVSHQMEYYIEYLSTDEYHEGGEAPSEYGIGRIHIIAPAGAMIEKKLLNEASEANILVTGSVVYKNDNDPNKLMVGAPIPLNSDKIDTSKQSIRNTSIKIGVLRGGKEDGKIIKE